MTEEMFEALKKMLKERMTLSVSAYATSDDLSNWVQVEVEMYIDDELIVKASGGC